MAWIALACSAGDRGKNGLGDCLRLIFHCKMARCRDGDLGRAGDGAGESIAKVEGEPGVLFAPDDGGVDADGAQERDELIRVDFVVAFCPIEPTLLAGIDVPQLNSAAGA